MKIIRFEYQGEEKYGHLSDELITIVAGNIFEGATETNETVPLEEVKVLPPVVPSKVLGLGLNYRKHVEEINFDIPEEPLIFLMPPSKNRKPPPGQISTS